MRNARQACQSVQDAGISIAEVQILQGSEGARILDTSGDLHDYATRVVRAMQKLGYDQTLLAIHDEGLRKGQVLLSVGCSHEEALRVASIFDGYGGHGMVWFGSGTAELLGAKPSVSEALTVVPQCAIACRAAQFGDRHYR